MMFKNNLSRTGTKVVAGSLKARGWFMLLIAMVMTPVFLKWGPSIFSSIELLEGRRPRPLDEFGRIMFGPIAASILGIIFFVMAIWLFKLHRESAACLRLDDAAERLGVDTRDLARIIEERGVRPRFMRDGELVYTIDDITGAANLLRPADNVPADALLRPAASARTGEVASMLRPILVSAQDSTIKEPAGDEQVIRTQSREK